LEEVAEAGEVGAGVRIFLGGEDATARVDDGAVGAAKGGGDGSEREVREQFAGEGHGDLTWPGGFAIAAGASGEGRWDVIEVGDGGDDGLEGRVGSGEKSRSMIMSRSRIHSFGLSMAEGVGQRLSDP